MHGRYDGTIEYDDNSITVDGKKVQFFAEMDPKNIPWGKVCLLYTSKMPLLIPLDSPLSWVSNRIDILQIR